MRKFVNYQEMKAFVFPTFFGKYRVEIEDSTGQTIENTLVDSEDEIGGVLNKHGDGIWIEKAT